MELTQDLRILNEKIAHLIKEHYDKEPDRDPDDILMTLITHGFFQYYERFRINNPKGELSLEELTGIAIDMVFQILKYTIEAKEGIQDEKDSQEN